MATVKDRDGIILTEGDLILVFLDPVIEETGFMMVYKDYTKSTKRIAGYRLTEEGYNLARYDNGDFAADATLTDFYRQTEYTISNIKPNKHVLKITANGLDTAKKKYYDLIQTKI